MFRATTRVAPTCFVSGMFITESFSVKRLIDPSLRFGMTWGVSFRWNSCSLVKLRIKTDLPCTDLLPQFLEV